MSGFFGMSKGDFVGTAVLFAFILAILAFNLFYTPPRKQCDLSPYADKINAFERRQAAYADSLEVVRSQRDSMYASRKPLYANRHSRYGKSSSYKEISYYQKDTSSLHPLPKKQSYLVEKVELNRCDTTDIIRIPGFGSKRAKKIVEYRDRLGGFHSIEQLHEIYILQNVDLAYCEKYFTVNPSFVKKIKVNTAGFKELRSHPYFDAYLAKTVVGYREKNGKLHNLAEFQKVTHAYQELMDKLSPYLSFE